MTDEENEAIEWLKRLVKINKRDNLDDTFAEILLNLIEKQSKEIEELKEENEKYKNPPFFNEDNYTSNDKIKAKIEEYEKEIQIRKNVINNDVLDKQTIEKARIEWACMEDFIYEMQSLLEKE